MADHRERSSRGEAQGEPTRRVKGLTGPPIPQPSAEENFEGLAADEAGAASIESRATADITDRVTTADMTDRVTTTDITDGVTSVDITDRVATAVEPLGSAHGHWEEYAEMLLGELAAASSRRQSALLAYELARVYETHLGQPDRALALCKDSCDQFPGLIVNVEALSRMLQTRGDYAACVRVLESEINGASSSAQRAAVKLERAQLRVEQLRDFTGAREDLFGVLETDPDDPMASQMLADLCEKTGEPSEAEMILRRRLRRIETPATRALLLTEIARLRERYHDDVEGAAKAYQGALSADSTSEVSRRALLRIAVARNDYPTAAVLCASIAESGQGLTGAGLLWRGARLYLRRLRNADLAATSLEAAARSAPDDPAILYDLCAIYEGQARWDELAGALERQGDLAQGAAQRAELRYRTARVVLERLQDADRAIGLLRQAVGLSPEHRGVRTALGRLYARHQRFQDLAALLSDEMGFFRDPERRATTAFRLGDIYENRLDSPEFAIEVYEEALRLRPGYRPAIIALGRVYARVRRYEDLVATFERQVAVYTDKEERLLLLQQISDVWEQLLGDPAAALSAYERMIAIDPTSLAGMRALHRIYAMGTRWADLVQIMRAEVSRTTDRWRQAALLTEIADVHCRRLGDPEAAIDACFEAVAQVPAYQPALMSAGRLLSEQGDFERLIVLHRQELDGSTDSQHKAWLLLKIGRLLSEKLGRDQEAAEVYQEAIDLADNPQVALDLATRVARKSGDAELELSLLLRTRAPDFDQDRVVRQRRIARLMQHQGRREEAVEQLKAAMGGPESPAFDDLLELLNQPSDRKGQIEVIETALDCAEGEAARLYALHRLARLYGAAKHDLHRAAQTWERVLEIRPRDRVALRQMEVLCAQLGRWRDLVAVLELQREPVEDAGFRLGCALTIAELREDRLEDTAGAAQAAVEVLDLHEEHTEALSILERHARQTASAEQLLQVLGRQLKGAQTAAEQAAILTATAAAHANRGAVDKSCEFYRLALDVMPTYLPAVRGWYRAARKIGDPIQTARALELEARASRAPERQTQASFEAGKTWQHSCHDPERAGKSYRRVLKADPLHQGAFEALSNLLEARKEFRQLITLLESQVGHVQSNDRKRDLWARMAEIQQERLGDLAAAQGTIEQALELFPQDRRLLTALAELSRAGKDYQGLLAVNLRLIEVTDDPSLLRMLRFQVGRIYEEELSRPDEAIASYRKVLDIDGNDLGSLRRLSGLLLAAREWDDAARVTEQLVQRDSDRVRAKSYHLTLAHICHQGFGQIDQALDACRRALVLDPGGAETTESMADLLVHKGDLRGLHAHLESVLAIHRAHLDKDPFDEDSYRGLARVFRRQEMPDRLYVVSQILGFLGAAQPAESAFAAEQRDKASTVPQRPLNPEEVESVLVQPELRGALRQVLCTGEPVLRKVIPPLAVARRGVKVSTRNQPRLAASLRALSDALGGAQVNAYWVKTVADALVQHDAATPVLQIGKRIDQIDDADQRFLLARALARVRLQHNLFHRLGIDDFGKAMAVLLKTVSDAFSPPPQVAMPDGLRQSMDRAINVRVRNRLEPATVIVANYTFAPADWLQWIEQSEDRLALAVCGDVHAALRVVIQEESGSAKATRSALDIARSAGPRTRQLLGFAVSEEYLTLRERLAMAIDR